MSAYVGLASGIAVLLSIHGETATYNNATKTLIINRREGGVKLPSLDGNTNIDTELVSTILAPLSTFAIAPIKGEVITDSGGGGHTITKVIRHPSHWEIKCTMHYEEV